MDTFVKFYIFIATKVQNKLYRDYMNFIYN